MRGRRGRPGLIGTAARTAVIAGTATAVSGSVQRSAAARAADQQAAAAAHQQALVDEAAARAAAQVQLPPAPAAPAAPAPPVVDRIAALKELAELKAAGVLTEAEFAAEKARVLAS